MNQQDLVVTFKQHGYKMTPQRRAILEAITAAESHPSAEQLYEVVRESMPDTSRATVYNTLRELVTIIHDDIDQFVGTADVTDDMTVLAVRFNP